MRALVKFDNAAATVIRMIISLMLFVIMCILFVGVIFRYFLNSPIIWVDELATYLLVSISFLGGYIALRSDRLVKVTFVVDLFPEKIRKWIVLASDIIIIALLLLIGFYSVNMLSMNVVRIQKTVALRIPMMVFYCQIPIMVFLMLVRMVINVAAAFNPNLLKDSTKEEVSDT